MRSKPSPQLAMKNLLAEIRQVMPFGLTEAQICSGICIGCSKKLLEFLSIELDEWDRRLIDGELPKLGDIEKLAKISKKIHRVMVKNKLIN